MSLQISTYPPLVSVTEAQRMLGGRGRGKIYALIESKHLQSVKDGSRRLIVTETLLAYVESLKLAEAGEPSATD